MKDVSKKGGTRPPTSTPRPEHHPQGGGRSAVSDARGILDSSTDYIQVPGDSGRATLDGYFTVRELEAVIWLLKHRSGYEQKWGG